MKTKIEASPSMTEQIDAIFAVDLKQIGVDVDRNIYKNAWEVAWYLPPHPFSEGPKTVQFRSYRSLVFWPIELLNDLAEYGGVPRVREAVLGCRVQEQVEFLAAELRRAVRRYSGEEEV